MRPTRTGLVANAPSTHDPSAPSPLASIVDFVSSGSMNSLLNIIQDPRDRIGDAGASDNNSTDDEMDFEILSMEDVQN